MKSCQASALSLLGLLVSEQVAKFSGVILIPQQIFCGFLSIGACLFILKMKPCDCKNKGLFLQSEEVSNRFPLEVTVDVFLLGRILGASLQIPGLVAYNNHCVKRLDISVCNRTVHGVFTSSQEECGLETCFRRKPVKKFICNDGEKSERLSETYKKHNFSIGE
jgi:hypothetical protein